MKLINCAIIQDLLPSYCDKVSSKETNSLVEEHLSECAKCREKFKTLNKDLNIETTYSQQDEIDFLKGYRRSKRRDTIFAITVVLIIVEIIFILFNSYIPNNFTGRDYPIDDINDVNLEYMYWESSSSNSLSIYLYSDKYKELKGYVGQIINTTGGHEILIQLRAKRELRPFVGQHTYVSGFDEYVDTTDIDRIWIESSGNRKEIWNKNTKVPSKEEWARWYIDSYVPQKVKDEENMNYDTIMYRSYPGTGMWRHLYKPNLN